VSTTELRPAQAVARVERRGVGGVLTNDATVLVRAGAVVGDEGAKVAAAVQDLQAHA
jgi:hypothetical protein